MRGGLPEREGRVSEGAGLGGTAVAAHINDNEGTEHREQPSYKDPRKQEPTAERTCRKASRINRGGKPNDPEHLCDG